MSTNCAEAVTTSPRYASVGAVSKIAASSEPSVIADISSDLTEAVAVRALKSWARRAFATTVNTSIVSSSRRRRRACGYCAMVTLITDTSDGETATTADPTAELHASDSLTSSAKRATTLVTAKAARRIADGAGVDNGEDGVKVGGSDEGAIVGVACGRGIEGTGVDGASVGRGVGKVG